MQQAFQKQNQGQLQNNTYADPTQRELNGQQFQNNQRQPIGVKAETNNFATVTANTGNMIMGNQPINKVVDMQMQQQQNTPGIKLNSRGNSKSNCFQEMKVQKNVVTNIPKFQQQNHHTLQCISDINDFKHKINMVLQNQAFPGNSGSQNQMQQVQTSEIIPTKQINGNSMSLNPTSRIVYPQSNIGPNKMQEIQTPSLNKANLFPKRNINAQARERDVDVHEQQVDNMTSAFQSFKQNLKQQHQQFIKQVNPNTSNSATHHHQNNELQESMKFSPGTYLLRSQKEKNRNQYQAFKNAQVSHTANVIETPVPQKEKDSGSMTKATIHSQSNSRHPNKKSHLSNMLNGQNGGYSHNNQKQQQRRKLLFEYGAEKREEQQNNIKSSPGAQTASNRNSKPHRNSVFSLNENSGNQTFKIPGMENHELMDNLNNLSIDMLDEKDRDNLRKLSLQYQQNLQQFEDMQKETLYTEQPKSVTNKTKLTSNESTLNNKSQINLGLENSSFNSPSKVATNSFIEKESEIPSLMDKKDSLARKSREIFSSAEKFKENEKHLNEDRLKKESKIEIPLQLETRKLGKSNTPLNADDIINETVLKESSVKQQAVSDINLKRNVSSHTFSNNKINDDKSIFKNDNKRLQKLIQSENITINNNEDMSDTKAKMNTLQALIENLDKPKAATSVMGARNQQQQLGKGGLATFLEGQNNGTLNSAGGKGINGSNNPDWMQGMHPVKLFLSSLNCAKPTPQQINVMNNSKQRLDLFKILQAREHVKFTNIQSEKMMLLHTKLEQDFESRNADQGDLSQNESSKFIDFVIRNGLQSQAKNVQLLNQFQQKQMQSMHNLQQLKNMQKQQQNDQKAFSIFQMNELAQFRSMSDGQQKQILLNNLQQGKFDEFEGLLDPPAMLQAKMNSEFKQKNQEASRAIESKLSNNKFTNSSQYADQEDKKSSMRQNRKFEQIDHTDTSLKDLPSPKNNAQRRSMLGPNDDRNQNNNSMNSNQIEIWGQSNKESTNVSQGPQSVKMLKYYGNSFNNNAHSEQISKRESNEQQSLHVIRKNVETAEHVQEQYEESKTQFEQCLRENMLKQQRIKIFYQQMNEAFGSQYHQRFYNHIKQSGLGLENLLPYLPRHMFNNGQLQQQTEQEGRDKVKLKSRQSLGISNIAKPADRPKQKPNTTQGKEIERAKKEEEKEKEKAEAEAKKEGEGEDAEELVAEVKKPRYFPPKRLPNPFENAAQEQEKFIQARKEALAKYSQISKNRFKQDESQPLKYVIRPGNNSKLLNKVLEQSGRLEAKDFENGTSFPGWEQADEYIDSLYNFKWKPTSGGIKYDLISKHGLKQLVNHVKGHQNLTTKDNLFINMKHYYETQKVNIYDSMPITIVLDYQKDDIGDKVEVFLNILRLIEKNIDQDVSFLNSKMHEMQNAKEKIVKSPYQMTECCHNRENLWLLKPTGFNRGIGIHLFQTFDQLRDIMSTHYGIGRGAKDKASIFQRHNENHQPREYIDVNGEKQIRNFTFVVQKLIERPMLYLNRKFDIRMWVILNSSDGKVYLYQECYVRTSSKEYTEYDPSVPSEDHLQMQLTNNAVQKDNADYGKFEEGNIVSLDTLCQFMAKQSSANGRSKNQISKDFYDAATKSVTETIKSVKGKILQQKYTFELFGYDYILDENCNTYLIEVNTNPCLEESNKLLRNLLPRMLDDAFNIVMDPLFTPGETKYKSKFPLPGGIFMVDQKDEVKPEEAHPGYKDTENLFKHVCNLES